jgi:hypothetical protein
MSENLLATDETTTRAYPAPLLRMLPAITFGVRAAALAGMAVSAGSLAFGLAGAFETADAANSTCCGVIDV